MFNVFQQPWTLLIAAVLALFILLITRDILPQKHRWRLWLIPVFFAVAAFGADFLVQTDPEKISAVITTVVKAVEEENPALIEPLISENYHDSFHRTKKGLMIHCTNTLSGPLVEKNIKRVGSIEISDSEATAIFTVRTLFDPRSYIYQEFKRQIHSKVKLNLRKHSDTWLITRIEILQIDRQPATWDNIIQLK